MKEANVWCSLNKLHANVIKEYITKAKIGGFEKINFVFGNETKVSFSIILK